MAAAKPWYYRRGDQEFGPIVSNELRRLAQAGEISPEDLVYREGLPDWVPATRVKGLFDGGGQSPDQGVSELAQALGHAGPAQPDIPDELREAAVGTYEDPAEPAGEAEAAPAGGAGAEATPVAASSRKQSRQKRRSSRGAAAPPADGANGDDATGGDAAEADAGGGRAGTAVAEAPAAMPARVAAADDIPVARPPATPPPAGQATGLAGPRTPAWDALFAAFRQVFDARSVGRLDAGLFSVGRWALVVAALLVAADLLLAAVTGEVAGLGGLLLALEVPQPMLLIGSAVAAAVVLLVQGMTGQLRRVFHVLVSRSHLRVSSMAVFDFAAVAAMLLAAAWFAIAFLAVANPVDGGAFTITAFGVAIGVMLVAIFCIQPAGSGVRIERTATAGEEAVGLLHAVAAMLSRALWAGFAVAALLSVVHLAMGMWAAQTAEAGGAFSPGAGSQLAGMQMVGFSAAAAVLACLVMLLASLLSHILLKLVR